MSTSVPGSYARTSREISFSGSPTDGGALAAQCQKIDGSWVASTLQYDIANMNGVLTVQPGGSYQLSSRNIHLENGAGGVYLVAECRTRAGAWVQSRLKLADIANIDGVLKYE
jgi:hypothetical protein